MPSTSRKRVLSTDATTTNASEAEARRWLNVYYSAVEFGRTEGYKQGHREGHKEGWEQGYNARAAEDEAFAQDIAERLYREGIRADDRKSFIRWVIESGRALEARQAQRERFNRKQGLG